MAPPPIPLFIETDLYSDVDDVGALAIAHSYADRGAAEILGIGINTPSRWGVPCARVIDTWFGRPDIPVGGFLPTDDSVSTPDYARRLATEYGQVPDDEPEPASELLVRTLRSASERSVVIVSLGFFPNLLAVLDHRETGEASGTDLVREKVAHTVVMGGRFPAGVEFNVAASPLDSARFVSSWPGTIDFVGWEVGASILSGPGSHTDPHDPVTRAYRLYAPDVAVRSSWDPIAVDLAVGGTADRYELSPPGRVTVAVDGATYWTPEPGGPHRYVARVRDEARVAHRLSELMRRSDGRRGSR